MDSIFVNAMALVYGAGGVGAMLYGCNWKQIGRCWNRFPVDGLLDANNGKATDRNPIQPRVNKAEVF